MSYLNHTHAKNIELTSLENTLENRLPQVEDYLNEFHRILDEGVYGFCFALYEESQKPGDPISEEQVRRRLAILKNHTSWIRSFSVTEGNELIPIIAKEMGFKTLVGAWLGNEKDKNDVEIENLIALAERGVVDIAAVGNEVLYRNDLTEGELLEYIHQVRQALPSIPVGYVDAYYEFVNHPKLIEACEILLCNCYPFWEKCPFSYALPYMNEMYQQVQRVSKGKKIMVTETGWPSQGQSIGDALPSRENALRYFVQTQHWAKQNNIDVFYFSSFDESWKKDAEGDVGAYWGIWDKHENLKF